MGTYINKHSDGIIYAPLPENMDGDHAELYLLEFIETINNEPRVRVLIDLAKLKEFPITAGKIKLFTLLKKVRKANDADRIVFLTDNPFYKMSTESLLFVTGHRKNTKILSDKSAALKWLNE